jgi:hypothetical protein
MGVPPLVCRSQWNADRLLYIGNRDGGPGLDRIAVRVITHAALTAASSLSLVIPAKAGTQHRDLSGKRTIPDPRLRGDDLKNRLRCTESGSPGNRGYRRQTNL